MRQASLAAAEYKGNRMALQPPSAEIASIEGRPEEGAQFITSESQRGDRQPHSNLEGGRHCQGRILPKGVILRRSPRWQTSAGEGPPRSSLHPRMFTAAERVGGARTRSSS